MINSVHCEWIINDFITIYQFDYVFSANENVSEYATMIGWRLIISSKVLFIR